MTGCPLESSRTFDQLVNVFHLDAVRRDDLVAGLQHAVGGETRLHPVRDQAAIKSDGGFERFPGQRRELELNLRVAAPDDRRHGLIRHFQASGDFPRRARRLTGDRDEGVAGLQAGRFGLGARADGGDVIRRKEDAQEARVTDQFRFDGDGFLGGFGPAPVEDAHRPAGAVAEGHLELLRRGDARRLLCAGDLDGGDRVARLQPRLEDAIRVRIVLALALLRLRNFSEHELIRREDAGDRQAARLVVFRINDHVEPPAVAVDAQADSFAAARQRDGRAEVLEVNRLTDAANGLDDVAALQADVPRGRAGLARRPRSPAAPARQSDTRA